MPSAPKRGARSPTRRAARARDAMSAGAAAVVATHLNAELAKRAEKSSVFLCVLCGLCRSCLRCRMDGRRRAVAARTSCSITLDTVRADRIGAYGYAKASTPVLDRLAREGVRFADATTQAPLTAPAHAALLTGLYPARIGVRDNATTPIPETVTTAAEAVQGEGLSDRRLRRRVHPDGAVRLRAGVRRLRRRLPRVQRQPEAAGAAARRCGRRRGARLARHRRGRSRSSPGCISTTRTRRTSAPAPFDARFKASPYDGEIAYVDACIGRLIAALERSGRLDRTIVAVVADHGESLGEHGEQEHGMFLYEGALRIPWIMRLPGRAHAGRTVAEQVRAIDVLPTLAALAGVAAPRGRWRERRGGHRRRSRAASRRPPTPRPGTRSGTTAGAS